MSQVCKQLCCHEGTCVLVKRVSRFLSWPRPFSKWHMSVMRRKSPSWPHLLHAKLSSENSTWKNWSQLRSSCRTLLFLPSRCWAHFEYFFVLVPLCLSPPAHSLSVFQSSLSRDNLEADQPPWWLPGTSPPLSASSNHPWQESRHLTKCRCQGNDLSTWNEQ